MITSNWRLVASRQDASRSPVSIGVVAVFVQSGALSGKGFAKSLDNVFCKVDVAEARKSLLTETVIVSDDAPDKEVETLFHPTLCGRIS
jgi:hypothetical protein